jgi:hypothetical protein
MTCHSMRWWIMEEPLDYLAVEIGMAGALNQQALREAIRHMQTIVARISPLTAIEFAIGGYDDDPREIYEIPEARAYLLGFALGMKRAGIPTDRFLPVSINVIRCCLAAERGEEVHKLDEPLIDIRDELRDYQARVKRTMQ